MGKRKDKRVVTTNRNILNKFLKDRDLKEDKSAQIQERGCTKDIVNM